MSDCDVTKLMMQPQDYCSCVVCADRNKNGKNKKCSFADSDFETKYSETSCCSSSSSEGTDNTCGTQKTRKSQNSKCTKNSRDSRTSKSSCTSMNSNKSEESNGDALCPPEGPFDCDDNYTPSGMCPPKTVGPLGKKFDCCSKYAPCGHWSNCTSKGHQHDKLFDAVDTFETRGKN